MKYSFTIAGVIISVIGSILVNLGISSSCANELTQILPVLLGGFLTWWGRFRHGDITLAGFKK